MNAGAELIIEQIDTLVPVAVSVVIAAAGIWVFISIFKLCVQIVSMILGPVGSGSGAVNKKSSLSGDYRSLAQAHINAAKAARGKR
jgi:hypothetical protein